MPTRYTPPGLRYYSVNSESRVLTLKDTDLALESRSVQVPDGQVILRAMA